MAAGMNAPLYTTEILRLAASLPEPIQLNRVDGSASERSPTCGSIVTLEVQQDEEDRIELMSMNVQACAFGQASAALVAAAASGKTAKDVRTALDQLDAWLGGKSDDPPDWPGFAALAPARSRTGRHGAILLPLRALLSAMSAPRQ
jgi:NifU-like protein involved in Fe-S cluster formation